MGRKRAVPTVTTAPWPLSADVERRTSRYLVSMSVRIACFIGAVLTDGPLRWILAVAAIVLPYTAVVLANAGRERPDTIEEPDDVRLLPPGPTTGEPPAHDDARPPSGPTAEPRPPDLDQPDLNQPDLNQPGTRPPASQPHDSEPPDHPPDVTPPGNHPPDLGPPGHRPPDVTPPGNHPPDSHPI